MITSTANLQLKNSSRVAATRWIAILIFLVVLGWLLVTMQGLPLGDPDDWDHILFSEDTSWKLLLKNLALPWSTSSHWVGQTDIVDQTVGGRLFHGIALKFVVSVFGHEPFPFYFVNKALFFALTVGVLYLLLYRMTRSQPLALFGAAFYTVVPAHYAHVYWNSVPETMVHTFLVVCLYSFFRMAECLDRRDTSKTYWKWFMLFLASGWVGMKTKETAIILPLALGLFTLFRFHAWKVCWPRFVSVVFALALLLLLVVPITSLGNELSPGRSFSWETFSRLLFRNYDCGYENEVTTAFFSREWIWPSSIARTIGFYLLWVFVALLGFSTLSTLRKQGEKSERFFGSPLAAIALCWLLIELYLLGQFQPDPRYFSGTMIPLTILGVRLVDDSRRQLGAWPRRLVLGIVVLALGRTLLVNVQHMVWLRQQIGQRNARIYEMVEMIYRDQFPSRDALRRDLGLFYGPTYIPDPTHPRLERLTYYVAQGHGAWNKTHDGSLQKYEQYARKGAVYYVSESKDELSQDPKVQMIGQLDGLNNGSVFEKIIFTLKRKQPRPFYVFRFRKP